MNQHGCRAADSADCLLAAVVAPLKVKVPEKGWTKRPRTALFRRECFVFAECSLKWILRGSGTRETDEGSDVLDPTL